MKRALSICPGKPRVKVSNTQLCIQKLVLFLFVTAEIWVIEFDVRNHHYSEESTLDWTVLYKWTVYPGHDMQIISRTESSEQ